MKNIDYKTLNLNKKMSKVTLISSDRLSKWEPKLTKEDVWGKFDIHTSKRLSKGMIVSKFNDNCSIFNDKVPYKSVTVICNKEQETEVRYWLTYVHGGDSVSKRKDLGNKIALRSDYQCW